MGTPGFVGFVVDGKEKIAYHCDSNPTAKGVEFLTWLRSQVDNLDGHEALLEGARRLRVVSVPAIAEIKDLPAVLEAGVIEDASDRPCDSSSVDWGYLIDLDLDYFEVYEGRQGRRHKKGRFASRISGGTKSFPVALVGRWFFLDLPDAATEAEMIDLEHGD